MHWKGMALLTLTVSAACGGKDGPAPPPIPVDGLYRYTLERTRNTCSDETAMQEGTRGYIDVFARMDGLFDLHHGNVYLPLPFTVEGVSLAGSAVDHQDTWDGSDTEYAYSIEGTVTRDALDLSIWFRGVKRCEQDLRMTGMPFPIADPDDIEGYYSSTVTALGDSCDAGAAATEWNTVSTFWETGDGDIRATFFDYVTVTLGPRGGTDVDWQGTVPFPMGFFSIDLEATLSGTYGPHGVDLRYEQWNFGEGPSTTDCRALYEIAGAKRLPSLAAIDNDYRVHYEVADGCTDDPDQRSWDAEETARVTTQPDGGLWLQDRFSDVLVLPDGADTYTGSQGAPEQGATLVRTLRIAPPDLSATYVYTAYAEDGTAACTIRVDASGLPRYVFE